MAKTIIDAQLGTKTGASPSLYVRATVEMPASEYAAFLADGALTNAVPTAVTNYIAARLAAGTSSGG